MHGLLLVIIGFVLALLYASSGLPGLFFGIVALAVGWYADDVIKWWKEKDNGRNRKHRDAP